MKLCCFDLLTDIRTSRAAPSQLKTLLIYGMLYRRGNIFSFSFRDMFYCSVCLLDATAAMRLSGDWRRQNKIGPNIQQNISPSIKVSALSTLTLSPDVINLTDYISQWVYSFYSFKLWLLNSTNIELSLSQQWIMQMMECENILENQEVKIKGQQRLH